MFSCGAIRVARGFAKTTLLMQVPKGKLHYAKQAVGRQDII